MHAVPPASIWSLFYVKRLLKAQISSPLSTFNYLRLNLSPPLPPEYVETPEAD
jgi:hypothetical protein